jgi:membrane protease YdiL (CAAX protease family)/uncharacterized RDD family membrane protein YckC
MGRRAGAALIDLAVLAGGELVALIVGAVLVRAAGGSVLDVTDTGPRVAAAVLRAIVQSAVYLGPVLSLYLMWRRGASVGMRATRCRLRDLGSDAPPRSSQVVLRLCGLWFSVACAGLGLIWGWTRPDRRGWSDLLADTIVVHQPPWSVWSPAMSRAVPRTPWTWTDVVPVVVLLLPLSLGVEYVTVQLLKWLLQGVALATRRPFEAVGADLTAYGAAFLVVLLFVKVRRHASLAALGLRRVQWRWLLAALPFASVALVVTSISGRLSESLFPNTPANQCMSIRSAYDGAPWLAIVGVAAIAPVVEEIVFRGMVFGWLRGRTPLAWAVVISAALFALEHIGFLQLTLFLPIFAMGVVLALLYHHARSIWPSVLVHATFNLVGLLVLFTSTGC